MSVRVPRLGHRLRMRLEDGMAQGGPGAVGKGCGLAVRFGEGPKQCKMPGPR